MSAVGRYIFFWFYRRHYEEEGWRRNRCRGGKLWTHDLRTERRTDRQTDRQTRMLTEMTART